jgi:hypothetical protein
MGGILSSTDPKIRRKLMKQTHEGRDLMSEILQFMLKQSSLIDFYSMADPERCKNYLVAGRDALLALFRTIQIEPDKKDGVLYFQRIDGLKKGLRPEDLIKQNQYCTELAFFYIRIFQIFGALTMSVLDVNIPNNDVEVQPQQQRFPDLYISEDPIPFRQRGGVLTEGSKWEITYDNYKILNKYLMPPQVGRPNVLKFVNYDSLYIDFNTMYIYEPGTQNPILRPIDSFAPFVYYNFLSDDETIQQVWGRLTLTLNGNVLKLIMTDFGGTAGNSMENKRPVVLKATLNSDPSGRFIINGKDMPAIIEEFMKAVSPKPKFSVVEFLKQLRYISDTVMNSGAQKIVGTDIYITANQDKTNVPIRYIDTVQVDKKSIRVIIDNCILTIKPEVNPDGSILKFTVRVNFNNKRIIPPELEQNFKFTEYREGVFERQNESSVPLHITTGQTIPNYLETIFKYIIERRSVEEVAKFERTREGYVKPHDSDRIPPALRVKKLWDGLTQDPPVKAYCIARAMQLLSPNALEKHLGDGVYSSICRTTYYLQNNGSIPKAGADPDTIKGIRALSSLFLETVEQTNINSENLNKLKEILKQPLPAFCNNIRDTKIPITSSAAINDLRKKANQLIERQIQHTANTMNIIQKLFYIKNGLPVVFHPNVKKGGMGYINQISNEARQLLLDYYGECEGLYNEGVQMLGSRQQN